MHLLTKGVHIIFLLRENIVIMIANEYTLAEAKKISSNPDSEYKIVLHKILKKG
jgi:hypothetical protein